MPKKARRLAFKCVLSDKAQGNQLILLNELSLSEIRTKEMATILSKLPVQRSVLITLADANDTVQKSARNIPDVTTALANSVNIMDLLRHQYLVMPVEAARQLETRLASPAQE
jgi:large subunit ribosomal protein L4